MSDMRRIYFLIPLIVFLGLALVLLARIKTSVDPSAIPSALLGKPAPEFELATLRPVDDMPVRTRDLKGKVTLVNFWASWCLPCRKEHPYLIELGKDERLQIVGINHKDEPDKALRFLSELGDPYDMIGIDPKGRTSIDFGVYGIPETFILDATGQVTFKWIGPITAQVLAQYISPAIEKAIDQSGGG